MTPLRLLSSLGLAVLLTGTAAGSPASPVPAKGFSFVRPLGGIEEYRLDANGLDVLVKPDHASPVVTFLVVYHVGSRNEVTGTDGATHLLEHLMFRGSKHYNQALGNSLETELERIGAEYNANTWKDRTAYFETVDRDQLELAIRVESDRMRNLLLRASDRKAEMTVVRNEFERDYNDPVMSLDTELYAAAYIAHPYHHPTIGWRSDIEKVSIQKLRDFYNTYYWPNNATVAVIGDCDPATALALVRKYYGSIPHSPAPIPEPYTTEPEQTGPRRVSVHRAGGLGVVALAYKTPPALNPDSPVLDVLDSILTQGQNSRLYHALVDKNLATDVEADNGFFHDNSLDIFYAFLAPGARHEQVEHVLRDQLAKIARDGVTPEEVKTAIHQNLADIAYSRDGSAAIAAALIEDIAVGDWTDYVRRPEQLARVTPADVQRVARKYLVDDHSTTGWFVPTHGGSDGGKAGAAAFHPRLPGPSYYRAPVPPRPFVPAGAGVDAPAGAGSGQLASRIHHRTIDGAAVYTVKTGVKDVVTLAGSLDAGRAADPDGNTALADLTARLLDHGTTRHNQFELAQKLAAVGASLSFGTGANTVGIHAKCLRADVPLVLGVLAEELRDAALAPAELAKVKRQYLADLTREETDTGARGRQAVARALFPAGHPNYVVPIARRRADAEKVSPEMVRAFYRAHYGPATLRLVFAGDVDDPAIDAALRKDFTGWHGGAALPSFTPATPRTAGVTRRIVIPEKTSVNVYFGQADGLRYTAPDRLPLYVGTAILGSGFSSRLMQTVRNRDGLTYDIYAYVGRDTYTDGEWLLGASFAPSLLQRGLAATREVVRNWWEHGVTADELAYRKTNLVGRFRVGLVTSGDLANAILITVQRGLPPSHLDTLPQEIKAVTLQQVNDAIRQHGDPATMAVALAGTLPPAETKP